MMKSKNTITLGLGLALTVTLTSIQPVRADLVDVIFGAGKFGRKASPIADTRCIIARLIDNTRFWHDQTWKDRVITERDPKFLSDREFLDEIKYSTATLGQVDTRYVKEFDTRFFYTATAKALPNGSIPMVDPDAKALIIYLHGSGTSKASGSNFAGKANALSKLNYSVVSFDLPFHADGSRNPSLAKAENFAAYLDSIIKSLRQPGQPVYIMGHSFGPEIIAEYVTRYPYGVDGALLLSPGGFNKVTQKWFEEKTVNMTKTFGEVEPNNAGGKWAALVSSGKIWTDLKSPVRKDPTEVNPRLKLSLVSGEKEEYLPGELDADGLPTDKPRDYDIGKFFREIFHNIDVKIVPKTGHYIFQALDEEGQDVVTSSILRLDGVSLKDDAKALKQAALKVYESRTPIDQLAVRNSKEPFFNRWLDGVARKQEFESGEALIAKLLQDGDKKSASKLLSTYNQVEKQRYEALDANIKESAHWAPAFYEENKALIERLGEKGYDASPIRQKYLVFLKSPEGAALADQHAQATEVVYQVAEKPTRKPSSVTSLWSEAQEYFMSLFERAYHFVF
jgi:pimeloyl-ACP methyl ester carboxylesterase